MKKESEAKQQQGYRTEQRNCGNCMHRQCDKELPAWMDKANREYGRARYTLELHGIEQRQRCGIGGFAIRKTATCDRWFLSSVGGA